MLPDKTTTIGDALPEIHINPFHIIKVDVTIKPEINPKYLNIHKIEICKTVTIIDCDRQNGKVPDSANDGID